MSLADYPEITPPTTEESELARESSRALSRLIGQLTGGNGAAGEGPRVRLRVGADGDHPHEETVSIPVAAFRLLMDVLNEMAQGNAVTLIPVHAELTTQQAADVLNVSRPFLIKLIEEGKLPCRMVGTHRRVLFSDLNEYKRKIDGDRAKALEELAAQAQDLGMGY